MHGSDPLRCASHGGVAESGPVGEAVERLVQLLQAGNYIATALAAIGVRQATFDEWLRRGDPDGTDSADADFRAFRERIEHAQAEGEARNVTLVARAAVTDWKAAAWLLERQAPGRWSRPTSRPIERPHNDDDVLDEISARRATRRTRRAGA